MVLLFHANADDTKTCRNTAGPPPSAGRCERPSSRNTPHGLPACTESAAHSAAAALQREGPFLRNQRRKQAKAHPLLKSLPLTRRPGAGRDGVGLRERGRRTRSRRQGRPERGRQNTPAPSLSGPKAASGPAYAVRQRPLPLPCLSGGQTGGVAVRPHRYGGQATRLPRPEHPETAAGRRGTFAAPPRSALPITGLRGR